MPIAAAIEVSEPAGVIDMQEALGHHPQPSCRKAVNPAELEALAISVMWDDAGWLAPGRLHLSSDAGEGPWSLDQPTRGATC